MASYVDRSFVAIARLATPPEVEASFLGPDLGLTPYETRQKLASALPAIVLSTTDAAAATALVTKLRHRGHRALLVRAASVTPASRMVQVRSFTLDADALTTDRDALPWDDIHAIVRAKVRTQTDATETVKEKKFDLGRAVMTGGLVMRKTSSKEVHTQRETSEQVLYLFRASGETPWILREQRTNYSGLGDQAAATANLNIGITCTALRARAYNARYDETLLRRPGIDDPDLYAYLISLG